MEMVRGLGALHSSLAAFETPNTERRWNERLKSIEDVLKTHGGVKECAAFGGQSNRFGSVPMAAYTIQPGWAKKQIEIELDTLCREHLGKIRPRNYIALDTLPKGNTGKVLRRELSRIHSLKL